MYVISRMPESKVCFGECLEDQFGGYQVMYESDFKATLNNNPILLKYKDLLQSLSDDTTTQKGFIQKSAATNGFGGF